MQLLDTTAVIETPERVRFRHRVAGPGPRALAWFADTAVAVGVFLLVVVALSAAGSATLANVGNGIALVILFLLQWGYFILCEGLLGGRTPGKMIAGIRAVRDDGSPLRLTDVILRNLLRAADFLPFGYGIGVAVMSNDPRFRRIGDIVSTTTIVPAMLGTLRIEPPVTDEERERLPGRVDLDRAEIEAIETFLRRRSQLSAERAEELAALFGPALGERTGVSAPTWTRVLALCYARAVGKDR